MSKTGFHPSMQETDCVLIKGIDYSKQEPYIGIKGVAKVKPLLDF